MTTNTIAPVLILVSSDWMMQPRIQAAAQHAGWDCRSVLSLAQLDSIQFSDEPERVLILADLAAASGLSPDILSQLRSQLPNLRVVVFGPHVQQPALDRAAASGCDAVWTNGQLQRSIESGEFPCSGELWPQS